MDELGFNKIAGAILATALGVMMIREVPHLLMHSSTPTTPIYQVGLIVQEGGGEEAKPLPFPQADWVAAMDATKGAKVFKKCTSCHNADKGGAKGTGPNLWNLVGAPAGGKAGFKYSSAMSGSGLTWDYETLDGFLAKPTKYLKGTNMNFIGVKKPTDRAAVIEYLRIASDNAAPKPEAVVAEVMVVEGDNMEKINSGAIELKEIIKDKVEAGTTELKDVVKDKMDAGKTELKEIVTDIKDAPEKVGDGH